MKKLITILTLTTLPLISYAEDRDYGNLVPMDFFTITNAKTSLKDNAEITNFQINVTPKKEEFEYKVNNVRTPRKAILGKRSDFKLTVDKEDGKITRLTSVNFSNGDKGVVLQMSQSTSIANDGSVNSRTFCTEDFKINFFGLKKKESGFKCVTVNKVVCDYIAKNNIEAEITAKIKECSDLLGKLNQFQKDLFEVSKKDMAKDLRALSKVNGRLTDARNFYEIQANTLTDVSDIANGYTQAIEQCGYLKQNGYFPEVKEEPTSGSSDNSKKSSQQ
jgi:hypothetical protein